jgi:hypothetical protein
MQIKPARAGLGRFFMDMEPGNEKMLFIYYLKFNHRRGDACFVPTQSCKYF